MVAVVQACKKRLSVLKADRQPHESVWRDCADYTFPALAHGLQTTVIDATDAQRRQVQIYDPTAGDSVNTGAASIMGAMVPSNAQWYDYDVGSETEDERRWLDGAARFGWENIHSANFDAEAMDCVVSALVHGWFVLYCDEHQDEGGLYFEAWPVGECWVAASRAGGRIDTVYRERDLTVGQVVAEYGLDSVSEGVRRKHEDGKIDERITVVHVIEPRSIHAVGASMARNLPWASVHYESATNTLLRESGYHEFPCMVPRWRRLPGSTYATGPVADALPTVKALNEAMRLTLLGAETAICPPLKVVDDGVINARNMRVGPRKILTCASVDSIEPLMTGAKVEIGFATLEQLQGQVKKILLADQLPPADGPVKTAYEWSVRVDQMRKILGPLFARFQAEFLQGLVERVFGLTWRANERSGFQLLGRPPQSLAGRNFSVRYLSPLARAQRLEDVAAMDRFEQTLAAEAAVDSSVLDVYDFEEAARQRHRLLGVPQKTLRDQKAIDARRKAQAQAQAQAQQQAVASQGQMDMQSAMAQRLAQG